MKILLLSDIHGNYPGLEAIDNFFAGNTFEYTINSGDSTVYGPFPNEVLDWLRAKQALSILGNTDKKVLKLLQGEDFKKPSNPEKRIMYQVTAKQLSEANQQYLRSFPVKRTIEIPMGSVQTGNTFVTIGIYHGSPARPHEFLSDSTPESRFYELAEHVSSDIVVTGHSHSPYHKYLGEVHFINPGSAGRMFDSDPSVSCAVIELQEGQNYQETDQALSLSPDTTLRLSVRHHRIPYDISLTTQELQRLKLPPVYVEMYRQGRKLN
ncbi:metallophosphoesterase family protein [Desulfosediminicola sp.]|uniref:metallophosphoesterase family protein n=1 Tax=Desulfosediminicola sp. TaxID=2886825 RepID=UPI003AF2C039